MGPLAAFAHLLALLFAGFGLYFLLTLRAQARAERLPFRRRAVLEAALPVLAIYLCIPLAGVVLDRATALLDAGAGHYLVGGWGMVDQSTALWLMWALLCLIAAIPLVIVWEVDHDLARRVPQLPRLAHRALVRTLTGFWPLEPQARKPSEEDKWKALLAPR